MKKVNILLTSVGRRSYLAYYFKKAIGNNGLLHVSNSTDISTAFQVADRAVVTPLIYDSSYIPFLLKYCKDNQITAVLSLFDADLPVLAENRQYFDDIGTKLIVSDKAVIDITNDKWRTYEFLKKHGFDTPKTFITVFEAINAIELGEISYPLIIKPRWGCGSIAVCEADNERELLVLTEKVRRTIKQSYLKYESSVDYDNCVIIQEKLNGKEYGIDIINDLEGNYCSTIVKRKYAMRSGETDCAITVDNDDFTRLGCRLGLALKHLANMDCDVFETQDGKKMILEMNARFGGGYPFSHMAGVDLPMQIVQWLLGEKTDMRYLCGQANIMSQKDISMVKIKSELVKEN